MAHPRLTRGLTLGLGLLYLTAGVAKTGRVLRTGDGGPWFWSGSLLGGGVLVLAGLAMTSRHPRVGRALICTGGLMGIVATRWTVVVPLLALVVVVLNVQASTAPDAGGRG